MNKNYEIKYTFKQENATESPTFQEYGNTYHYFSEYSTIEDAKDDLETYFEREYEKVILVTLYTRKY